MAEILNGHKVGIPSLASLEALESPLSGLLWKFYRMVMIDEVIGNWLSVQPPGPLPSSEVRGWD